jgi:hypothetical protein
MGTAHYRIADRGSGKPSGAAVTSSSSVWPFRGWVGLALVAVFWALNWGLDGMRTHWGFFPLWLGFCLVVDALTYRRTGTSLWDRSRGRYVSLFIVSVPAWWLFEVLNWRAGNWLYQGREQVSDFAYLALGSLSFSTVIPAVFGSAELAASFPIPDRWGWSFNMDRLRRWFSVTGLAMLLLLLAWPRYFFPFLWTSLFLVIDPFNDRLGNRSLLREASVGDWKGIIHLAAGSLFCGFFWELWNFYSYPRWIYDVPFVGFWKLFEMPLLGYGGYLPFGLELFALYALAAGIWGGPANDRYVLPRLR